MSTYKHEARGWYQTGNYERVLLLADSMMKDPHARDSTQMSIVNEVAALASERMGSDQVEYWYQMAFYHERGRSVAARMNLRRNAGISALARGDYSRAQDMASEALSLSTQHDGPALLTAKLHVFASAIQLARALDNHSSDLATGRQHVAKARRIFQGAATATTSTDIIASWVQMLEVHEAAYVFQSGSPSRAARMIADLAEEIGSPTHSGALLFLHEIGARIELHRGRYAEALRHLDHAELLCSRPMWKYALPTILRLRVHAGTKMNDTQLVLRTLKDLRDIDGIAAEYNYRAASVLAIDYLPSDDSPWWPWVMMIGVVLGVAGYVHTQHSTHVLDELITPFHLGSIATSSFTSTSADTETYPDDATTKETESEEAASDAISASAPANPSGSPESTNNTPENSAQKRRRSRLNVYGPHGGMLGTMPVPRLLRRDAQSHFVGIEMGDRILIVEQFSAASNDVVQRTDGGGFERFELPFKISGVVVASIARSSGSM